MQMLGHVNLSTRSTCLKVNSFTLPCFVNGKVVSRQLGRGKELGQPAAQLILVMRFSTTSVTATTYLRTWIDKASISKTRKESCSVRNGYCAASAVAKASYKEKHHEFYVRRRNRWRLAYPLLRTYPFESIALPELRTVHWRVSDIVPPGLNAKKSYPPRQYQQWEGNRPESRFHS
jgi:hypothetical protein